MRKGARRRSKLCLLCGAVRPYTLDKDGDPILAEHAPDSQMHLPKAQRTPCLGSGSAAVKA